MVVQFYGDDYCLWTVTMVMDRGKRVEQIICQVPPYSSDLEAQGALKTPPVMAW